LALIGSERAICLQLPSKVLIKWNFVHGYWFEITISYCCICFVTFIVLVFSRLVFGAFSACNWWCAYRYGEDVTCKAAMGYTGSHNRCRTRVQRSFTTTTVAGTWVASKTMSLILSLLVGHELSTLTMFSGSSSSPKWKDYSIVYRILWKFE
jgi:hypothetical protein